MFVLVVGGGKVGYYLTKELIESGHEVVLMEKDRARAAQIADELGTIVVHQDGCEGNTSARPARTAPTSSRRSPATTRTTSWSARWPSTTSTCPDDRARQQPEERGPVPPPRRGRDHQPDPDGLAAIEQDIPVHELLHLAQLDNELELIEAQLQADSPASAGRRATCSLPEGCSLFVVVRDGVARRPPGHDLPGGRQGDRDLPRGLRAELHDQLIGAVGPRAADSSGGAARPGDDVSAAGTQRLPLSARVGTTVGGPLAGMQKSQPIGLLTMP